ncbi:hypothetical protein LINGRAHAP2_LOCUS34430 [Linum grandiflorum]
MIEVTEDLHAPNLDEEKEDVGTKIPKLEEIEPDDEYPLCAVGTLHTDKVINFQLFKTRMADLWRSYRGIRIEELEE